MINFDIKEIQDFIDSDIPSYQKEILFRAVAEEGATIDFYDSIGKELTGENNIKSLLLNTGPSINKTSFWEKVKDEVYLFICTNDDKYKTERKLLGDNFKAVATIIATAIAATFSLGVGVVVGIVTNILISIVKINQNAWCELQKEKQ